MVMSKDHCCCNHVSPPQHFAPSTWFDTALHQDYDAPNSVMEASERESQGSLPC